MHLTEQRRSPLEYRTHYLRLARITRAEVAAHRTAGMPYTPRRSVAFYVRQARYFHALILGA